jgi:type I restriction enzyme M protein
VTTLGEWIKAGRQRLGLNQAALAAKVSANQSYVSLWEKGTREPSAAQVAALATLFGTPAPTGTAQASLSLASAPPSAEPSGSPTAQAISADEFTAEGARGGRGRRPKPASVDVKAIAASGAATGTTNGGSLMALTKELWEAAVTLRGSIEPSDYKRYVLPIIFLRFLSLRFEKRRAHLEALIADPANADYHGDTAALEDDDEYRKARTFKVPEQARWSHIVKHVAQADDVKVKMDDILTLLSDTYPDRLRGLLPKIYGNSNLSADSLRSLINLFSKDVFEADHGGEDVIGRVYEYFIGEFAASEGKRGGEYFTPASIVRTLVAMLEPTEGKVYDPCCGSGGMFVQSDRFTNHAGKLSFYGQESKDFTWRLCKMNLFIHGIDGNIELGDTYINDRHATLKADVVIANPPFNDGSKGQNGWGADKVSSKDARLDLGLVDDTGRKRPMPLAARNANTLWMLHFLHHLAPGGTAGYVMATGELSNSEIARLQVRQALVDLDFVDAIVQMPGQLFANTQIPCALWFLSRSRDGQAGTRSRKGEILFIDARKLGALIPGSRKQKQLGEDEIARIAAVYRQFKREGLPCEVPGFCKVAQVAEIKEHKYALTPGRYVGSVVEDDEDEPFEERFPALRDRLLEQFSRADNLVDHIKILLDKVSPNA